jgi:RHS repeat-associated protein
MKGFCKKRGGERAAHQVTNTFENDRDVLLTKANTRASDNSVISAVIYTVNNIGQRTNATRSGAATNSTTWGYDALGQVTRAADTNTSADRAYQYDGIGNRIFSEISNTQISDPAGTNTTDYTPNALNQYDAINTFDPSYDDDGNQEDAQIKGSAGLQPATFHWDGENRKTAVKDSNDNTLVSYHYDSQSRRIASTTGSNTTLYIYDAWNCIAEYKIHSSLFTIHSSYLWGLDISGSIQGAGGVGGLLQITDHSTLLTHHFPIYDGNGNVTEYIDISENVVAHYEYDAFGNTTIATGTKANDFPYRFSTKPRDTLSGLYYYGYRWYDPLTGRWPSRDPIEELGGGNLYGYVGNSSIDTIDILGLYELPPIYIPPHIANQLPREINQQLLEKYNGQKITPDPISGNIVDDIGSTLAWMQNEKYNTGETPKYLEDYLNKLLEEANRWGLDAGSEHKIEHSCCKDASGRIVDRITESSELHGGNLDDCFPKYLRHPFLKAFYDLGGNPKTGAAFTVLSAAATYYAKYKNSIFWLRTGVSLSGAGVLLTAVLVSLERDIKEDEAQAKKRCLERICPRGSSEEILTEIIPPYHQRIIR